MAVTSAPQAMPPQHLWDPKTKSAHLKMAQGMRVSPWGSFPISFSPTCKIFHPELQCMLIAVVLCVDSCLYLTLCDCSPSCFDPDYLLLAYLWLGLSWIDCISTIKHFPHQKQAAGTLHQQQAAGEAQQTHSVEITMKLSRPPPAHRPGLVRGGRHCPHTPTAPHSKTTTPQSHRDEPRHPSTATLESPSQPSPLRPTSHRETRIPQAPIRKW